MIDQIETYPSQSLKRAHSLFFFRGRNLFAVHLHGLHVSDVQRYAPNVHRFDGDTPECALPCKIVHKLQTCPPCGHTLSL